MPRFGYPVLLEVAGRRTVVIGERAVRERKVQALLEAGADDVLVVATAPAGALDALAGDPRVRVERRSWRPEDLEGAVLVIGWGAQPRERARLALEARACGALVNVIDDVPNCDVAAPAVVRRGDLVLAIGTGGAAPALARRLRGELQERFGPDWAEVVEVLREVRLETLPLLPDVAERSRRWRAALDPAEAERLVRAGRAGELRRRLLHRLLETEEARA